jgi:hypothetical protein
MGSTSTRAAGHTRVMAFAAAAPAAPAVSVPLKALGAIKILIPK